MSIVSDGCGFVVAWASGDRVSPRLIVARSLDGATVSDVMLDEVIEDLGFWELAMDRAGEPILVTHERLQVVVRRSEGDGFGAPRVLNTPDMRTGIAGRGGIVRNSRFVQPITSGGALITFWEYDDRRNGNAVVAEVGADEPLRLSLFGGGPTSAERSVSAVRACRGADGAVAIAWLQADGRFFTAVGDSIEGDMVVAPFDGHGIDVACDPFVAAAFSRDDQVVARWESDAWVERGHWLVADPAFIEVQLFGGPTHAVVAWTSGYDSVRTHVRSWAPDALSEPLDLGDRGVWNGCSGASGVMLATSDRDEALSVVTLDASGSLTRDWPLGPTASSFRADLACHDEGRDLVAFERDGAPWIARLSP